jgi:short-subunit dehydrogenase
MTSPRTVLITGAFSGIGLELARCFARDGDALVLTGRESVALAARAFLPGMMARVHSGVLNIGSIYSFSSAPWQALYGAAKSWLLSFSLSLREETRDTGVNVTILCAGTTLSGFRTRTGHRDRASWFAQTSAQVAETGYRGFQRKRAVIAPGIASKFYVLGTWVFPISWLGRYLYLTAYRIRGISAPRLSKGKKL